MSAMFRWTLAVMPYSLGMGAVAGGLALAGAGLAAEKPLVWAVFALCGAAIGDLARLAARGARAAWRLAASSAAPQPPPLRIVLRPREDR